MRYGGLKPNIDRYRVLRSELDEVVGQDSVQWIMHHDELRYKKVKELQRLITQCGTITDWMLSLEWTAGNIMPASYQEITQFEYMGLGDLGHEAEDESYYEGFNIPNEPEWFGGWSCHIRVYGTYGTVLAHIGANRITDRHIQGEGIIVPPTSRNGNTYIARFFRIGCDHKWRPVPSDSSMHYHVFHCQKCNSRMSQDSSG